MKLINEDWLNIIGFAGAGLIICIFFVLILVRNKKNKKTLTAKEKIDPSQMKLEQGARSDVYVTPSGGTRATSNAATASFPTGLERIRSNLAYRLSEFFLNYKDKATRDETLEKLFEILISCDVGVETTELLVSRVKSKITASDVHNYKSFESLLKSEILEILSHLPNNPKGTIEHPQSHPHVVLLVGVNGVGKTTTTGKLAYIVAQQQKKVIIGAADTFRAAAVEQLAIWAERAHAELIQPRALAERQSNQNADPASVAFECVKRAVQENFDLCLIDTAGRLQTRQDLMQELSKVGRVIAKNMPEAPHEVLLVLDASMGQNAIEQAKLFQASVQVTGIVLTKLDGTAKGGVVLAIASKLKLPIRYIGVGEGVFDLQPFNANEYTEALFS